MLGWENYTEKIHGGSFVAMVNGRVGARRKRKINWRKRSRNYVEKENVKVQFFDELPSNVIDPTPEEFDLIDYNPCREDTSR